MPTWPAVLAQFIVRRRTRYVLSWLAALGLSALQMHLAWSMFDSPRDGDPATNRRDGNLGHTLIDFGGQWVTAHLVAQGRGRELYSPAAQREVLDANYPRTDEPPAAKDHDADVLYQNMMDVPGKDD